MIKIVLFCLLFTYACIDNAQSNFTPRFFIFKLISHLCIINLNVQFNKRLNVMSFIIQLKHITIHPQFYFQHTSLYIRLSAGRPSFIFCSIGLCVISLVHWSKTTNRVEVGHRIEPDFFGVCVFLHFFLCVIYTLISKCSSKVNFIYNINRQDTEDKIQNKLVLYEYLHQQNCIGTSQNRTSDLPTWSQTL